MVDVDIFVSTPTKIDWDIYGLWLKGYTGHEASAILYKRGMLDMYDATFDDLLSDTMDSYRLFDKLEIYLKNPEKITEQQIVIMTKDTKHLLLEYYYQFDDEIVREILGKKLTTRGRKDMEDISDRLKVPLRSCRRQFDNIKRVYKEVEDLSGHFAENIRSHMLLSTYLSTLYASIVFMMNMKFDVTKKRLAYLTCSDLLNCADLILQHWSTVVSDDGGVEIDREFLHQLRDIKTISEAKNIDDHKIVFNQQLHKDANEKIVRDAELMFKTFSKHITTIGSGLSNHKDMKNLFSDTVDKIVDPIQHLHWSSGDLKLFLDAYHSSCLKIATAEQSDVYNRYLETMNKIIIHLYHT